MSTTLKTFGQFIKQFFKILIRVSRGLSKIASRGVQAACTARSNLEFLPKVLYRWLNLAVNCAEDPSNSREW
jgi:hypothetical protein